jgi:hypothetical protein
MAVREGSEGVHVHNAVDALVVVLEGDPVFQRPQQVAKVQPTGRSHTGENSSFGLSGHEGFLPFDATLNSQSVWLMQLEIIKITMNPIVILKFMSDRKVKIAPRRAIRATPANQSL